MKKIKILILFLFVFNYSFSQSEYGKTLNVGIGFGYYNDYGGSTPLIHLNYELDVSRNFTIAPFISFYSYGNNYNWSGTDYYRVVVIPLGAKGTYYFDELLEANDKWDFYAGASIGFAISRVSWDRDYRGDRYYRRVDPLFLDIHLGAEYHISSKIGIFMDLSTGSSTFGIAFH